MKRTLTLLLTVLLTASAVLAGCSQNTGANTPDTTAPAGETTAEATTEAEETRIPTTLPEDHDLEGYVLNYYGAKIEQEANNSEYGVYAEEQNGDIINDAVYVRNHKVMEQYNFDIAYKVCSSSHPIDSVKPVILAGDDAYDVILEGAQTYPGLASEGMIVDLTTLDYMSLDSPWWPQTIQQSLMVANKLFATVGSHMIRVKTFLYTVFFNHKLAADYGIDKDALYQSVRDYTWTLEALYKNAKLAKKDLNGDGKYDANDLWGCSGESYCAYTLAYGAGVDYVTKDENDLPHISVNNERNMNIITDVLTMMTDPDVMLVTNRITGVENVWTTRTSMLVSDQYLFFLGQPGYFAVREMESDFGILPSPLYSEEQDFYRHTTTVMNGTAMMIPVSAADPQKVGFISEALCYESYYSFLPEFYKNYVETKYARDDASIEMLQLIHDTIYYDLSGILVYDKFAGVINGVANTGTGLDSIVSKIAANEESAQKTLETSLEKILNH